MTHKNSALDDLDLMLVKELGADARQSSRRIAKKLGLTPPTIQRRLERLINEDILAVVAMPAPAVLGFNTRVIFRIRVAAGKSATVVEHLKPCPDILNIILTAGRYDIMAFGLFRSLEEQISFMDRELGRVPYLVGVDPLTQVTPFVKDSWIYLQPRARTKEGSPHHRLDDMDLKLIGELELRPRDSIVNLAKRLEMNRKATSARLRTLLDANIIKVVSVANPSYFGYGVQTGIFLRANFGKIRSVANALAADNRVLHVAILAGKFNIYAWTIFRDLADMYSFTTEGLGAIPGIAEFETMILVRAAKHSYGLVSTR
ncbi:MAG: hypothetical protein A2Y60_06045 [Chloroflexi bacterium RBG_13_54_9]|nr:MAG: hypothetical protein A2Y60_06045 [Chloroflexi bacterium RBG_13_54_9]